MVGNYFSFRTRSFKEESCWVEVEVSVIGPDEDAVRCVRYCSARCSRKRALHSLLCFFRCRLSREPSHWSCLLWAIRRATSTLCVAASSRTPDAMCLPFTAPFSARYVAARTRWRGRIANFRTQPQRHLQPLAFCVAVPLDERNASMAGEAGICARLIVVSSARDENAAAPADSSCCLCCLRVLAPRRRASRDASVAVTAPTLFACDHNTALCQRCVEGLTVCPACLAGRR